MTDIKEILGTPFTTRTGVVIPDYALPLLEAYYNNPSTPETYKDYTLRITNKIVAETITALQNTLTKLNGNEPTDDLSLLPKKEYALLENITSSKRLPPLPGKSPVGSAKYEREVAEANRITYHLWRYIVSSFQLPVKELGSQLTTRVDQPYKTTGYQKAIYIWGAQVAATAAATAGAGIPLLLIAGNPTIATIGGLMTAITFIPAPFIWELYEGKIKNHRLKKFYQHQAKLDLETAHKEIESFLLQTRN